MTRLRRLGWKKLLGLGVGSAILLLVAFVGIGYAVTDVPQPSKLATAQSTRVLYADGKTEIGRIGKNRTLVTLDQVSDPAQKAVLAAEDRQYYSEPGISPRGILRALFANVKGGGVSQGGSTITQQYAKNAFLTQQRTFSRKLKEVFISLKLSHSVSKDKILEDYLNTIYFGRGAYGIEAASQTYFGVPASKLTAAQGAVLASSIRSPSGYDPARHADVAKQRWAYVLDGMVKQGWLSAADRAAAAYPKVDGVKSSQGVHDFPGPLSFIKDKVVEDLAAHGFPEDRITAGGLVVTTTLSATAQAAAIKYVDQYVPADPTPNAPVAALASVEPGTGKVIAYFGGRTPGGTDFAGSTSARTGVLPGSSMKPYVLAAALEKGMSLDTRYDGSSPQDICGQQGVTNDQGDPPFGRIDLATALKYSVNTVYLRLACDVGPKNVVDAARAAGIPDVDPLDGQGTPSAQIALGSGGYEVHPLDQAVGYATFAAKGQRAAPYFVSTVKESDGGGTVFTAKSESKKGFSEGVAADVTYAMQQVVDGGTGAAAALADRPVAGKTGTTTSNTNAWFVGITPQLSTAVWLGRPQGGPLKGVLGVSGGIYGGKIPAEVFHDYVAAALAGAPVQQFPPRANVGNSAPTGTYSPRPTTAPTTGTPTATPTATGTPTPVATLPSAVPSTPPPATLPPATSPPTATPVASISPAAQQQGSPKPSP